MFRLFIEKDFESKRRKRKTKRKRKHKIMASLFNGISTTCCGANKRVDSANNSEFNACECVVAKDNKGRQKDDNRYNKCDDFICRNYKRVCKCPWRLYVVFS